MNNNILHWQIFPRDLLPEVLFGVESHKLKGYHNLDIYEIKKENIAVGYPVTRQGSDYAPPGILVLDEESAAETFSWLRVYAPETSPLSQFARVISNDDWKTFNANNHYKQKVLREDIWASVIVGEALAQGEADVELAFLPLSRASGCFTTAIARAASIHGTDDATRTCANRLRQIEADRRFVKRSVSVEDLLPIWALAGARFNEPLSPSAAADLVLDAAAKYMSDAKASTLNILRSSEYRKLASDSIEERVLVFQRLVNELMHSAVRDPRNGFASAIVAAAAFLVGRSTTHEFLLRRVGRAFPEAPVWFGLIAALAGPRTWDPYWARAVKGIERQIRSKFDWVESSGFDLCWSEFAWFAKAFNTSEIFSTLPKLMPKVISVEIVPGATCQFRLALGSASESESRPVHEATARERELQSALAQFIGLATRTRSLLEGQEAPVQLSLGLEDGGTISAKATRSKKFKPS
ncbi:hypothetical protein [Methylomonas rapida]|uniref:Uncharacterized protein n=1 Tax=Methylomonas rapida TaxID=2963939 RepID=A0ABY7GFV5_9GAMM|nr:hypothetical protein [Methylomonas rapida]WAR43336.1 hypothetical protein NM686_013160 [Methylomonas rapida]